MSLPDSNTISGYLIEIAQWVFVFTIAAVFVGGAVAAFACWIPLRF